MVTSDEWDAQDGPAQSCVFCDARVPADGPEIEVVTDELYLDADFGETVPARRAALCLEHAQRLRERTTPTTEVAFR